MKQKIIIIIILEGIATSGKTTIANLLEKKFKLEGLKPLIVDEETTLMKIHLNTDKEIALNYLNQVLEKLFEKEYDVFIFDRLYFTHIFRTNSQIEDFKEIEDKLKEFDTKLIYLKINEKEIKPRILRAIENERAQTSWVDYVYSRNGGNFEEYYVNQQRKVLKLLEKCQIKTQIVNVTKGEYENYIKEIF